MKSLPFYFKLRQDKRKAEHLLGAFLSACKKENFQVFTVNSCNASSDPSISTSILSLCFSLTWQESTLQIARDAWGIKHRRTQHAKREKALALALCRRS